MIFFFSCATSFYALTATSMETSKNFSSLNSSNFASFVAESKRI